MWISIIYDQILRENERSSYIIELAYVTSPFPPDFKPYFYF